MRKSFIILFFSFSMSLLGQSFEGEIIFEIKYFRVDSGEEVRHNDLKNIAGYKSIFLTKDGYEKQITDSQLNSVTIFSSSENRFYYKDSPKNDTLFFRDLKKSYNTPFEYEIENNADTIAGYSCNKLIYKSGDGLAHFYFAPELRKNPKYSKNFRAFNKNKIDEMMKSYCLRYDIYAGELIIRAVAIEVKERKLSNKEFILPEHKILIEKYGR